MFWQLDYIGHDFFEAEIPPQYIVKSRDSPEIPRKKRGTQGIFGVNKIVSQGATL